MELAARMHGSEHLDTATSSAASRQSHALGHTKYKWVYQNIPMQRREFAASTTTAPRLFTTVRADTRVIK